MKNFIKNNKKLIKVIIICFFFSGLIFFLENIDITVDKPLNLPNALQVDKCNLSGKREKNVVVDIGVDTSKINREYLAYTNEFGQLVKVEAKELILQTTPEELSNGRYCNDEAKVPGTEKKDYDEGHVIADSLGGASNAYNITPQKSNVNRKGGQQYELEQEFLKILKEKGTIKNVIVNIEYENNETQIPSKYFFSWEQNGSHRKLEFENK